MDKKAIAQEWFEIAKLDFESAKYLQSMQPVPIEIICYHCQQTAEKYLKGFLAYQGQEVTKTHDLVLLNKLCQKIDAEFQKIAEDALLLTDYVSSQKTRVKHLFTTFQTPYMQHACSKTCIYGGA